jgi:cytochrome c oxidase assembly protein subunit 15
MQDISDNDRAIMRWLLVCLLLVFSMMILGAVTRLTDSGLSMVTWHPTGVLPPINSDQWMAEFELYRQFPEYQKLNRGMTLDSFKSIYWFEYSHRMLGRLIGLVFLLPFCYFWLRKMIKPGLTPRLVVMFFLGGLQGMLGWYMVQSGLVSNPQVSQYRLTAHLLTAILIYGFILWTILNLAFGAPYRRLADSKVPGWRKASLGLVSNPQVSQYRLTAHLLTAILIYGFILWTIFNLAVGAPYRRLADSKVPGWRKASLGLVSLVLLTIVSGGFVAGLNAGLIFNTFPLMGGNLIPEGIGALSPWFLNPLENMVSVQFNHRWLAIMTGLLLLVWYIRGRSSFDEVELQRGFKLVGMMIIIQLALGIATLLLQVPVVLGALHQAGALLLFSALLFNIHALSRV